MPTLRVGIYKSHPTLIAHRTSSELGSCPMAILVSLALTFKLEVICCESFMHLLSSELSITNGKFEGQMLGKVKPPWSPLIKPIYQLLHFSKDILHNPGFKIMFQAEFYCKTKYLS